MPFMKLYVVFTRIELIKENGQRKSFRGANFLHKVQNGVRNRGLFLEKTSTHELNFISQKEWGDRKIHEKLKFSWVL